MFYSKSTGGFYSREIHGDNIPADAVEITKAEHTALLAGQAEGKRIVPDADGVPVLQEQPPFVAPDVEQVTMRQARLALLESGKLDLVAPAIDQLSEPGRTKARIEWEFAQDVRKDWPALQLLAPAIGLDADALTALFNHASTL
jgi:hypothetical protein